MNRLEGRYALELFPHQPALGSRESSRPVESEAVRRQEMKHLEGLRLFAAGFGNRRLWTLSGGLQGCEAPSFSWPA